MPIDTDLTALIIALPLAWALLVIVMRGMSKPRYGTIHTVKRGEGKEPGTPKR